MNLPTAKQKARELIKLGKKASKGPWTARRMSKDDSGFVQAPRETLSTGMISKY